jgi:SAM-dependent MidA family methyltransferase
MFVLAHELYDALPIHQFKYLGNNEWCEKVIKLTRTDNIESLEYSDSDANNENVRKVLNPKKFFSKEALKDLVQGDTFEFCPEASSVTE